MIEEPLAKPFRIPSRFGPLPGYGGKGLERYLWKRPARAAAPALSWCCLCKDDSKIEEWDVDAAPYILTELEWKIWHHLPRAAARRQWMRGRVAAKDAVRLLLLDRYGKVASLETISVLPDDWGQPQVSCTAVPETGAGFSISISHCGNRSVALAVERSRRCLSVGLDVASREDNHEGLAEGGFVAAETALLDGCPPQERSDWLLCLWCAKEAVGKALGVGLQSNPLNYAVRLINCARRCVAVEINVHRDPAARPGRVAWINAHVGCDRGLAFAVARLEDV